MIKIYTDGAARGNPGNAAVGFVMFKGDKLIKKNIRYIGKATNNIAEYTAIINALRTAPRNEKVEIYSDSKLVVNQLNGDFKVKKEHLKKLYARAKMLMKERGVKKIEWVPRDTPGIVIVDTLINKELDKHKR
ncbi:MAG: ribonuclease HI family protein [Nanoarchaeota archaeon]|nr:ribonuclease HI family protein [Nanoarchaeota archaeon]